MNSKEVCDYIRKRRNEKRQNEINRKAISADYTPKEREIMSHMYTAYYKESRKALVVERRHVGYFRKRLEERRK